LKCRFASAAANVENQHRTTLLCRKGWYARLFSGDRGANISLLGLKGDFEVCVLWVYRSFLNPRIFDVTAKEFTNITYTVGYVIGIALGDHLDGTIGQVADPPHQSITVRYIMSREAKADSLHSAAKNYVFCGLTHCSLYTNLK
jgi:hypothetical protein